MNDARMHDILAPYLAEPRDVQTRSRGLTVKDLGNPQDVFKHTEEDDPEQYWTMGLILGVANAISTYTDSKEVTVTEGLKGFFRLFPSNMKRAISEGGILYLPKGIHEAIAAGLRGADRPPQISFALEFRVHRDSNPSGRTYTVKSVMPVAVHASDPLSALEAQLRGVKALPGREEAPSLAALKAPEPAENGGADKPAKAGKVRV